MVAWILAVLLVQAQPVAPSVRLPPQAEQTVGEAEAPLTPEAQQILDALRARVADVRARHAAEGVTATAGVELRRRVELDQISRTALSKLWSEHGDLPDRARIEKRLWSDIEAIDADNLKFLKSAVPGDGWFRKSRDGKQVVEDAWLILHHSGDDEFRRRTFATMESLARRGEIDGESFAFAYDRWEAIKGRPLRYGMHASCIDGWIAFDPIEDRANVDKRRKAIGLKPLATTAKDHNVGNWCGGAAAKKP